MCRWLAYSGSPVLLEDLLYRPKNSLIVQSLHSQLGAEETNGDGFGVGWYGAQETPAVFRSTEPAWNDRNLRELSGHISLRTRLRAHPRLDGLAGPADQLPPVPPRTLAVDAQRLHRRLPQGEARSLLEVDPLLYPEIEGTTDSRGVLPPRAHATASRTTRRGAVERAVGLHRGDRAQRHGVEHPIQMTVATTDGDSVWAFRYSSEGKSRSLFYSTDVRPCARSTRTTPCCTSSPTSRGSSSPSRWAISQAPGTRSPKSSYGVIQDGQDELLPFNPSYVRA